MPTPATYFTVITKDQPNVMNKRNSRTGNFESTRDLREAHLYKTEAGARRWIQQRLGPDAFDVKPVFVILVKGRKRRYGLDGNPIEDAVYSVHAIEADRQQVLDFMAQRAAERAQQGAQ